MEEQLGNDKKHINGDMAYNGWHIYHSCIAVLWQKVYVEKLVSIQIAKAGPNKKGMANKP